jgi:hypothetical protein
MLRPKCLQKNIVAFVSLALVILYITVPTLAQRTSRKKSESSGSKQAVQQQAEQEKQRQDEQAKQQQAERERQQKAEQAKQQQAERERQQKAEQAKQQQDERERQQKAEQARQQAERERQQRAEQAKQQAERERQQKAEQAKQQQAERERQQKAEQARQQAERERQQKAEQAKQQQAERERQQKAEQARQQAERERQQKAEQAKQQQAERERQQKAEQARQQAERERQQKAEQARQQQVERERQQQVERERQRSERVNRKQMTISPNDRDLELRTDDEMSRRVNRKLPPLPNNTKTVVVDNSVPTASPIYHYELSRPSHLIYLDRPYATDTHRREHIYVDYSSRICSRTITPNYRFILCYNRGHWHTFRYFYPYYHRKYVFVSLGGYWPFNYRFIRYYWYGYHPYYWCGYYPVAREVVASSYNYYTYNYYYDDNPISYQPTSTLGSQYYDNIYPQLAEEPAGVTLADIYFEEAVRAFEEGNYGLAIEKFAKAMELAPDDMILPFAYSQALFAAQRYTEATEVLRSALAKITSDKEGVFYPRGLYPKDEVLFAQLDMLTEKAELYKFDTDLQLLLGYQLLGLGQLDKAVTPLQNASLDLVNNNAATILLGILEKIKTSEVQNEENVTNYPESVITTPETKGVETETNFMSEIKFDDTQASAIEPNVICWSFSAGFVLMSLVSILCSCKSHLD